MKKVTLDDVSRVAGVSRSTASLVLRGSSRIPEATSDRVRLAMAELGYVYNRHAANMRGSESMTLGLIVTDIRNPYFAGLTMTIEEAAHDAGYTLFVGYSRDDVERQYLQLETMVQQQVDGIFLLPATGSELKPICGIVDRSSVPVVQLARYFSNELDYVGPNNIAAGLKLARHLSSLGATSAVLVGGPEYSSARTERIKGLETGFTGSGVTFDTSQSAATTNNAAGGSEGVARILDQGIWPDAIIAYSDAVALGIYAELRRRNLEPGRDVSVASFDDIAMAELLLPPLTSVSTYPELIGKKAGEILLNRIRDSASAPQRYLIEPTLKVRASTAHWRPRT
ncbi:LacI family transcriptional regulator [Arthrobacter sp. PvP023]|uniref:LacI family DNA-binding transcriptional regulator n=1 Tax=Arthrobacter sp. PvP023 TaxID=2806585 RepID=UPI001AE928A9|nr:LacI family DNA-binding transcriptional regulator [Arthrobacter sp. PvP023]MBP1136634.1 LacI family transcriptional regulator [Arthrobacter sp. PvP023]